MAARAERDIYRILITGSRAWPDELAEYVEEKLMAAIIGTVRAFRLVVVVHGDCTLHEQPPGTTPVDQIAARRARRSAYFTGGGADHSYLDVEAHPADWGRYGPGAGPLRNTTMVELGARRCLAFPDEEAMRGTRACFMKAIKAGIPTEIYPLADARRWAAERRAVEAGTS